MDRTGSAQLAPSVAPVRSGTRQDGKISSRRYRGLVVLSQWTPRQSDLDAANAVTSASPVVALAPFSHGPWWGFNGVQLVVLTATHLHVLQAGLALTTGSLRLTAPLTAIDKVTWRVRRGRGGHAVRMVVSVHGRRHRYVSKYQQAVDLCDALARSTSAR